MAHPLGRQSPALPDRVRLILATRGLSLAEVSRDSRALNPGERLRHISHNLYTSCHTAPSYSSQPLHLAPQSAVQSRSLPGVGVEHPLELPVGRLARRFWVL